MANDRNHEKPPFFSEGGADGGPSAQGPTGRAVQRALRGFAESLERHERRGLLAVSGGVDSRALLEAMAELATEGGWTLEVATLDHGLRPEASEEAARVEARSRELGLCCHVGRLALERGPGVEARARAARYAYLEALRSRRELAWIATAHTATDQAETLLMRLARGAALRGAAAILDRSGRVVRPLLGVTRDELEAFLAERGHTPSLDPMNRDPDFLRVRIRRQVLPPFRDAAGPGVDRALARFAGSAAEDEAFLEALAREALARLPRPHDYGPPGPRLEGPPQPHGAPRPAVGPEAPTVGRQALAVGRDELAELPRPIGLRVLRTLLEERGVGSTRALLERCWEVVLRGGSTGLPSGRTLACEGGAVRVIDAASSDGREGARELGGEGNPGGEPLLPGRWIEGPGGVRLGLVSDPETFGPDVEVHALPADVVERARGADAFPRLFVRTRSAGDRVRVPSGRHRKLQDVLVDARIPRERRDTVALVVTGEGEVVWIPLLGARGPFSGRRADRAGESGGWILCAEPTRSGSNATSGGLSSPEGSPPPVG